MLPLFDLTPPVKRTSFLVKIHFLWHAIAASKVTSIGHRDPYIGDFPIERID